ncbi:MAG: glycosyltransferase family 2 protein [Alphaproteobacteria bacterium]
MSLPDPAPRVSVVVPVMNEVENVGPLMAEIHAALETLPGPYEAVFVDDCSADGTPEALVRVRETFPALRIIRHGINCGQSAAIRTGVSAARAPVIVTLDGDRQNDPADIPALLARLRRGGAPADLKMVAGQRLKRRDSSVKKAASSIANAVRSRLLNDGAVDTGCGLKAFYKDSFLRLPYFDHMHRYIPALMRREGFVVEFVNVNHRPRTHGCSKYGVLDRLWVSLSDVFGVMWLNRRCRRPGEPVEW